MGVTFTSAGYGGTVTQGDWAKLATKLGQTYSVDDVSSWELVTQAGDRTVGIHPGTGYGYGVTDTTTQWEMIALPPVASGSRYDLIVARRDWANKTTSFAVVPGGSRLELPTRSTTPGLLDDQPIGIVRVKAGSAKVEGLTDLRVWGNNGSLYAWNELVLSYLSGNVGMEVNVNGAHWTCQIDPTSLNPAWVKESTAGAINLFGLGNTLFGAPTPVNSGFLVQAGTLVGKTDVDGYQRLTFPKAFPNGLVTVIFTDGDDGAFRGPVSFAAAGRTDLWGSAGYGNKSEIVYAMSSSAVPYPRVGGQIHRVNYVAIGY